jgi:hypothetical protein
VLLVLGLLAALAAAIGVLMHRSHGSKSLALHAGPVVDVSNAPGPQSETAVAVDARNPSVALAGSNDIHVRRMRIYSTTDGGRNWSSGHLPLPPVRDICATSDPGVAIAPDGTQYYSFLGLHCVGGRARGASIYVSRRLSAHAEWKTSALPVSAGRRFTLADDRPSITVDAGAESLHRGRLYVAWSRFSFDPSSIYADPDEEQVNPVEVTALVSHSDDRGAHWSKPVVLSSLGTPLEVRVAVARDGDAYVTWRDAKTNSIYVARSTDGTTFDSPRFVAAAVVPPGHSCHTFRASIPAQPKRCVSPNPVVAVDDSAGSRSGTVYLVWGTTGLNGSQDVDIAAFSPDLHARLGIGHVQLVNAPEGFKGPDQFLPTAAADSMTGRVWACYYQTLRPSGIGARFTCTVSTDGGHSWVTAVPATRAFSIESRPPANVVNGYGDYEAVAVAGDTLLATWTDGSALEKQGEEIDAARITLHEVGR